MAVNRITNKQVLNKESVNRVDQISTKNTNPTKAARLNM